ncbi:hypothetical protein SK571_07240 [Lentzea sp. BCCO 10_0798]|uniref:Uncharacterized protein n=1 Tax=Lentzea kristufekii TaxID=3095430 RepID=A0ABU4TM83_9PSEU|nr:hypothetical protein [Lentzea sp. BCCO 10_0798]MDX8049169.1 hypothetical protein [Lentzea sp. BCCO 10_0798]
MSRTETLGQATPVREKVGDTDACGFPIGTFTPVAQKIADEVREAIGQGTASRVRTPRAQ